MNLPKEQLKNFQKIFFDSYGYSISEEEALKNFIEISQLLKTIIRINKNKNEKLKKEIRGIKKHEYDNKI